MRDGLNDGVYVQVDENDLTKQDCEVTVIYSAYLLAEKSMPPDVFKQIDPMDAVLSSVYGLVAAISADPEGWRKDIATIVAGGKEANSAHTDVVGDIEAWLNGEADGNDKD